MIREPILFRPFFSLLLLLSFSPFCTYEPTSQIHPNDIDELIAAYKHYDADGDNWYYDYTVSVSIDSKTVHSSTIADGTYIGDTNLGDLAMGSISSAADPVATFVAVQVVREARTQD